MEVRIAHELEPPVGDVLGDDIRARGRERFCDNVVRRCRRDGIREGQRESLEKLRIGSNEVEDDRVRADDDPSRKVAAPAHGTRGSTDDARVIRRAGRAELQIALERVAEIPGLDEGAGRVPDAVPEHE